MAGVVQFGRRKGFVRSPGGTERAGRGRSQSAEDVEPHQMAVLSAAEWQRIQASLGQKERECREHAEATQRRQDRKLQSQNIVKHWENTIEGQRLKKLQARQLREEREEQERLKVDQEEAEFQAQCRKEAIEQAKSLLYHQTDRVKTFHGALLLSEVLRERDAQLEHKKRRQEATKMVDQRYIRLQEEERERGIAADYEATIQRAKAKHETSKFQTMQVAERQRLRQQDREEACAEQREIEKEAAELLEKEAGVRTRQAEARLELRAELDRGVKAQAERQADRQRQELAEARGIELFQQAKKRMSRLRKDKESELFQEFQAQQQKMADLLQSQRQQERSSEDEAIARAVAEQHAKKEQAEHEKERQFVERTREIQRHRAEMMMEKERREREQQQTDHDMLQQKRAHDLKFHQAQQEKAEQTFHKATELQQFLTVQVTERQSHHEVEEREEREENTRNRKFMEVEEVQFQEYTGNMVAAARTRGAPTQPLVKAAQAGAGGGRGPVFTGKAGVRPSYQAMDATAVELPSYQPKVPPTPANTQKRMGFTW